MRRRARTAAALAMLLGAGACDASAGRDDQAASQASGRDSGQASGSGAPGRPSGPASAWDELARASLAEAEAEAAKLPIAERPRRLGGVDYWHYPDEPMLPAYRVPSLSPLKADQYDDFRKAHPENYAITVPPPAGVRGMVEWEPMTAIVMSYPYYMSGYKNATGTVVRIAKEAAEVAEVWILVDDSDAEKFLKAEILKVGLDQTTLEKKVKFAETPLDSIWFIDSGPLPLVDEEDGTFAFTDFRYYRERYLDDGVPTWLGRNLVGAFDQPANAVTYRMPLNVEGGTYQTTSDGICFTGNRQLVYMTCDGGGCDFGLEGMPLAEVQEHETALCMKETWKEYAGCEDVIVTNSITDDGTGHIDMYLKVLDDHRVMVGEYVEPFANSFQEENAKRLDDTAAFLASYVKPDGTKFEVERLVMPGHREDDGGTIPFTYINSTFINGKNLWPATAYPEWKASRDLAESQWKAALPEYEHVWIDSTELSFWSGAIHCITRTIPKMDAGAWVADGVCEDGTCVAPDGGYDGPCQPGATNEDICYGPDWLCETNSCGDECAATISPEPDGPADECNGLTYEGCCNGTELRYCNGGEIVGDDCKAAGCGWKGGNKNYYDCGGAGEDPSGEFPLACSCADGGESNCSGKECGDDGCGGSCGTCAAGSECREDGTCAASCEDECAPSDVGCDGDVQLFCEQSALGCGVKASHDCSEDGKTCIEGACVEIAPPEPKSASSSSCGGSGGLPLWPAALALLGLAAGRRRRRA